MKINLAIIALAVATPGAQVDDRAAKKSATRLTVTSSTNGVLGTPLKLTFNLATRDKKGVRKRDVSLAEGGTTVGSAKTTGNGNVDFTYSPTVKGTKVLLAKFAGDKQYSSSERTVTLNIFARQSVELRDATVRQTKSGNYTNLFVRASVYFDGRPLKGVKVTATRPGRPFGSGPSSTSSDNGEVNLTAGLAGTGAETWELKAFGNGPDFVIYDSSIIRLDVKW